MNIFNLCVLYFAFGTFIIGLFVYLKRQDVIGRKWFFFSLTSSLWAFFYALWANTIYDKEISLTWIRMSHVAAVFIPSTWLDFSFSFLGFKNRKNYIVSLTYIISFLLSLFTPTSYFIQSPRNFNYFFRYYTTAGPMYHIFTVLFFFSVIYAFIETIKAYQSSSGEHKQQIKYLIWATGIGFVGGSLTFLPVYGVDFPQYNLFVMPLYPFIMAYALTRHHLLDIEQIAQAVQRDKLAAIGMVAASVNHEIRSPLLVIRGLAETILSNMEKGTNTDGRVKLALEKTVQQTDRVFNITTKLTEFSKPTDDHPKDYVHISDVVVNVLSFVEYGLKIDNINVEKIILPTVTIHADRKQLEQIFLNLILNAAQAMDKQPGRIKIEAFQTSEIEEKQLPRRSKWFLKKAKDSLVGARKLVEIRVSDTGPGIPPDKMTHLFEPFFTTKESGTGLGLYITKQLVERNNGFISVRSELGKGTTVILRFKN